MDVMDLDICEFFDEASSIALLRYAAGQDVELPSVAQLDPDRSVEFLRRHKAVGRTLARLERVEPRQEHAGFLDKLALRQARVEVVFKEQMAALKQFVNGLCEGMGVVLLKNQTAYFNSADARTLRGSEDLDVCVTHPNLLLKRCIAANLAAHVTDGRLPTHEFVNVSLADEMFDLHRYVAVWQKVEQKTSWRPTETTSRRVEFGTQERRLSADDLLLTSRPLPGLPAVAIPSVALSCVIVIAAIYRDFVTHCAAHIRSRPPARLSDLLETRDALNHPDFSEEEFLAAIEFYGMGETLWWFGGLMEGMLGDVRIAAYAERQSSGHRGRVHRLVGHAFWLPFKEDWARDLTRRPDASDALEIYDLTPATLSEGQALEFRLDDPGDTVAVFTLGALELDEHVILMERHGDTVVVEFELLSQFDADARIYFEVNSEMIEWDNVGHYDRFSMFVGTEPAQTSLRSFTVSDRRVRIAYDVGQQRELSMIVSCSVPQLPLNGYSGWLAGLRVDLG